MNAKRDETEAKDKTGTFLGIPYDWRRPSWARFKQRIWNPNDHHVFGPKWYGWGWTVNLYELAARLRLVKRSDAKSSGG